MDRICIVGLGLMGGSLAMAAKGFRGAEIVGVDASEAVCAAALGAGAVARATTDIRRGVEDADLVLLCVYAHHIPGLLRECADALRPGVVLSDICGVKTALYDEILPLVPEHVSYVGLHPMAGKERDGFENADIELYLGSGFLLCPTERSTPESVDMLRGLATHVGAARIQVVDYMRHDAIIAYTSDLMHISAAALCLDFPEDMTPAFTAGAFRDCTRVANINATAWTELLMTNRDYVLAELDGHIENLGKIRDALAGEDEDDLRALLQAAGDNKRRMLKR